MDNIRLRGTLAPQFFIEMWESGSINTEQSSILVDMFHICSELRNSFILILPANVKALLYTNDITKDIVSMLEEDMQSNVFFLGNRVEEECTDPNVSKQFSSFQGREEDEFLIHRKIINIIFQKNIPVLFDSEVRREQKRTCQLCEDPNILCTFGFDLETHKPINHSILRSHLDMYQASYFEFLKGSSQPTIGMIKYAALLTAFFCNIPIEKLVVINSLQSTREFLGDLRGVGTQDFRDISFSAFRAFAYASSRDIANADMKFSIDYHPNNPNNAGGFELIRCDVLEPSRNGRGNSGTRRLLIGRKNGKKILLGYTSTHDFTSEQIMARVRNLHL